MFKNQLIALSVITYGLLFSGCDFNSGKYELSNSDNKTYLLNKENGDVYFIDNKTKYKVVEETTTQNKIGEILTYNISHDYTKIEIKTKISNDLIYYKVDLNYEPKTIIEIDPLDNTNKITKDISKVNFEEWKKKIREYNKNYSLTLVFTDIDDFTVKTKDINLKDVSVNTVNGVTYEGSFLLDKSLSTKINNLTYYHYFPEFESEKK